MFEEEALRAYGEGHEAFALEIANTIHGGLAIDFSLISDDVLRWAAANAATKIVDVSSTTKEAVRAELAASLAEKETIDELSSRLRNKFDEFKGYRAEAIARTETAGAFNYGKYSHASLIDDQYDDIETFKTWTPTQDERTREEHRAVNISERTIPINQAFEIGHEFMMRPHDPSASAENVINCRCVLTLDQRDK